MSVFVFEKILFFFLKFIYLFAGSLAGILFVLLCLVFVNLVPDSLESRIKLVLHPIHVLYTFFTLKVTNPLH